MPRSGYEDHDDYDRAQAKVSNAALTMLLVVSGVALVIVATCAGVIVFGVVKVRKDLQAQAEEKAKWERHARGEDLPAVLRKDKCDAGDVPELISILEETDPGGTTEETRWRKAHALTQVVRLGPLAKPALPAVFRLIRAPRGNSADKDLQHRAAGILWYLVQQKVDGLLPFLLEAVHDGDTAYTHQVVSALCNYDQEARPAVPDLVALLKNTRFQQDPKDILISLMRIGPDAREAVPAIVPFLESKDKFVREQARDALGKIAPERKW